MTRFKTAAAAIALMAALAAPLSAQAHRRWILPSSTVLSGADAWIGIDGGISNQVFVADHAAMRFDNVKVTAPDGSTVAPEHLMQGQYRSTFDIHLTQPGTYKIANASAGMMVTWTLNGTPGRWRGPAAEMAANVPAGATDVVGAPFANRIETFATLGEPTTTVFQPTGVGIELVPVTHPTDVVAGEAATFQLIRENQPMADTEVTIARGGIRYRDNPDEMTVKTDAEGKFTVTWPEAGMYWINTAWRAGGPAPEGMGRGGPPVASASYVAVFEVLP
ncbi:DUF4198 domain-containing protein [Brevundimonas sp.]|uniref:DUF4198 domain-containing protein n=1 Tax=Brevundimonas sp. TaxID=1871086 RepID=UPI001A35A4C7|nr:DUF4198 domain-containing protein [Brevundimonas sp.]MBJ7484842.1 DUF4198 domain-containing protein [Brevundimonas sp.]